jgi:hypothetical protein
MHGSNPDPNFLIYFIHLEIIFTSRLFELGLFTFKLREIHFRQFSSQIVCSQGGIGRKLVRLMTSQELNEIVGKRSVDCTLDRVMGMGVNTPKPTIPVRCVDVVPIRANDSRPG